MFDSLSRDGVGVHTGNSGPQVHLRLFHIPGGHGLTMSDGATHANGGARTPSACVSNLSICSPTTTAACGCGTVVAAVNAVTMFGRL